MLYNVWIDDIRKPPCKDNLVYFKNAEDACKWFCKKEELLYNDVIHLYLDHDLGEGHANGYDFAKWLVEWNLCGDFEIRFHILSANPVGAKNIRQLLTRYGYREF